MALLTAMVLLTWAVMGALTWQGWRLWRQYDATIPRSLALTTLARQVQQLDQALTLSAQLAVVSRDKGWLKHHTQQAAKLESALAETARLSTSPTTREATARIRAANATIFALETRSMRLSAAGNQAEAQAILNGPTYQRLEADYDANLRILLDDIAQTLTSTLAALQRLAAGMASTLLLAALGLGGSWLALRYLFGRYQRDRQEALDALHDSHARIEAILASMAEGVLLLDHDGRVMIANNSAVRLLGNPVDAKVRALRLPDVVAEERDLRLEARDDHDHPRVLRMNRAPLPPFGSVMTLRDTTAEEAGLRARSEFVSMASHELRTPVTIVSGYAELLIQADTLGLGSDKREQILHGILTQARRLTRIVEDLLTVAQLDAGHVTLRPAAFPPVPLINDVLQTMALVAETRGMTLHLETPVIAVPPIVADAELTAEILTNLIDNAIKYSPPQSRITVSLARSGGFAVIRVSDAGPGIAAQDQSRIFDRFSRLLSAQTLRERGTGLGLAIARELAERQGGALVVCSEIGHGATFSLTLPLAPAQDATLAA
jgi:signal transduction histidine kinase